MKRQIPLLVAIALMVAGVSGFAAVATRQEDSAAAAPAVSKPAAGARAVRPEHAFGFQYVPKFDEAKGRGAWQGSRDRGIRLHRDLGVQLSREGFIWRHYEPQAQGVRPNMADFDDVVAKLAGAGIAMEAMVTETPLWAATAPNPDPKNPATYRSAPPRGLKSPIFTDGSDTPGPGKRVNPANTWAAALDHMVARYKGRITYWQMWNEPDYPKGDQKADFTNPQRSFFGSVDDYVRLLQVGHTIVKWRDPAAQVVTGGIGYTDYLDAMLARGAGRYFDQIDFHAYGWPGSDTALAQFVKVHDELKAVLVKHGLGGKGLICSETGYTALAPQIQADYIAKLYPTSIAMGVESTMYYANVNPSWKQMGLVDWRTLSQKTPGYWAYKNASTALSDVRSVAPLGAPGARGYRFTRASGKDLVVAWAPKKGKQAATGTLLLTGGPYQVRDAVGRPLRRLGAGTSKLALTESPVWVDADLGRAYAAIRPNPPLPHVGLAMEAAMADTTNENHGAPAAAIDLDTDTNWVSGTHKAKRARLTVKLRQPATVSRLRLKTGPTPKATWFDVEVSADGKTFRPVATRQRLDSWKMEWLELAKAEPARYVRLHWHNPAGAQVSFSVFELELH